MMSRCIGSGGRAAAERAIGPNPVKKKTNWVSESAGAEAGARAVAASHWQGQGHGEGAGVGAGPGPGPGPGPGDKENTLKIGCLACCVRVKKCCQGISEKRQIFILRHKKKLKDSPSFFDSHLLTDKLTKEKECNIRSHV